MGAWALVKGFLSCNLPTARGVDSEWAVQLITRDLTVLSEHKWCTFYTVVVPNLWCDCVLMRGVSP